MLSARIPLAHKKRLHPRDPETVGVRGAGVALKEREQDLRVHVAKQPERPGPEPLELRPQLVHDSGPRLDELLARPRQRPDRLRLITVRLEHPEAVMIGARQLAQHKRVKPIRLPARDPEPVTRRRDLVRMQRQHPQAGIKQPLHQQPIRPLDRDQHHLHPHEHAAQPGQALLVMRIPRRQHLATVLVGHEHIVRLRRPIDPGIPTRHHHPPRSRSPSQCLDPEVPLRVLIDKALAVGATSCCRLRHLTTVGTGWSSAGPPLKGKRSWPSPGGGRGNHSMSYERSPAVRRRNNESHRANRGR